MPVTVADTGPVSWDLGPGAEGHHGVPPYYLHCAPTVLHFLLLRPPAEPLSEFCLWVPAWWTAVGTPALPHGASGLPFRPAVKVGERVLWFSFWGISSGYAFASIFPKKKCPERELRRQALGTVAFTHLVEGACTLILLIPLVLKTRFQHCILGSSASGHSACAAAGAGPSPFPHVKDSSHLGGTTGANTSQPWGRRKEGDCPVTLLRVLEPSPSSLVACTANSGCKARG